MTETQKDVRYNKTFAEAYNQTNGFNIEARDILSLRIEYNRKEEYQFICEFDINRVLDSINNVLLQAGSSYCPANLSELLEIDNYFKFFNNNCGIGIVDEKAIKNSKKVIKFFDELLQDLPNKAFIFNALSKYYENNDLNEFHNVMHTKF